MKRKLLFSILLILAMIVSACGGGSGSSGENADGKIVIKYINGFTGGDGEFMKKITNGFNESQDKYVVEESQEKDHYTKFKTGNYDLVLIHSDNLETYRQDNMIQDISSVIETAGISPNDFHPVAKEQVTFENGTFAVPLDIHPMTMFYNKKLSPVAPTTYEEMKTLTDELQAQDPNLFATGIPSAGLGEWFIMTMAAQNGIDMIDGNHVNFAQADLADALMNYNDMIFKDKISPSGLGLDGEFQAFMKQVDEGGSSVQTATALTGPWYYGAVKEAYNDDLGIASAPTLGKEPGVYGGGHTLALPASVQDDEKKAGIAEFLKYMYTPENLINWADSGQAPTHLETMELVEQDAEKYPLAAQNIKQFDTFLGAPKLYQYREQMRYMVENVYPQVIKEGMTKEKLMSELEKAAEQAKQIADTAPQQ
ncbi:ABC-type glycerol-3-phosphate transport system substrate-binding protein [Planomicrobium soli]|uniref:ABC-type glycerol-3-phosphate transport system substrate-binding protein n=1 Tax=Planomicrobium soli TaxID=1176648 RepID=A0A2P8H6D4_9BACL|nr:extracellular solute-binding protein [Planomicrobium soli]PSL41805.1 ABC-type glycerol-3-phosphate transport system substrate-binding protein [Planomicrobium soli]